MDGMIPETVMSDFEHVANGEWYMVLAKGRGIRHGITGPTIPICMMEEQEFKEFVKRLLRLGYLCYKEVQEGSDMLLLENKNMLLLENKKEE